MCEYSGKIIAWLDRELPPEEQTAVAQHFAKCSECSVSLSEYERTSAAFDAFMDAASSQSVRQARPRWLLPIAGAAAAITAVFLLFFWQAHMQPAGTISPLQPLSVAGIAVPVLTEVPGEVPSGVRNEVHSRKVAVRKFRPKPAATQTRAPYEDTTARLPGTPVVHISIPVEQIFPLGAVPPGLSINADMMIGADGSVEWVLLQP